VGNPGSRVCSAPDTDHRPYVGALYRGMQAAQGEISPSRVGGSDHVLLAAGWHAEAGKGWRCSRGQHDRCCCAAGAADAADVANCKAGGWRDAVTLKVKVFGTAKPCNPQRSQRLMGDFSEAHGRIFTEQEQEERDTRGNQKTARAQVKRRSS
jgi:hypothetical protein